MGIEKVEEVKKLLENKGYVCKLFIDKISWGNGCLIVKNDDNYRASIVRLDYLVKTPIELAIREIVKQLG